MRGPVIVPFITASTVVTSYYTILKFTPKDHMGMDIAPFQEFEYRATECVYLHF